MKKWVAVFLAATVVIAVGAWLVWWVYILPTTVVRVDTAAALRDHVADAQREAVAGRTDQWARYIELTEETQRIREATGVADAARFEALWVVGASDEERQRATDAVGLLRDAGLFETSRKMASIGFAARPWPIGPDEPLVTVMFDELREARFLLQAQRARWETADASERLLVLRETLEISRLLGWQGSVLDHVVAASFAESSGTMLRDYLLQDPAVDDAWLRMADGMIAHALERWAPLTHGLAGDRLVMLDSLQHLHTERGTLSRDAAMGWSGDRDSAERMYRGPLSDSVAWLDELTEAAIASANATGPAIQSAGVRLESALDRFTATGTSPGARWPALMIVLSDFHRPIRQDRTLRITLAGTRVVLAIERHRLAHGQPPESLDELGELLPDGLDVDPVTEQPWYYQRTGDGYTLSSRALPGYKADEDAEGDPLAGVRIVP